METDLFIGGTWVPAASGERFDVLDPATGGTIARVADGGVDDAVAAVSAADKAAAGWAATPPRDRSETLRRAFELMTDRAGDLATLISQENGKALVDARGEVAYAAEFFRWYAEEAVRADGSVATAPSGTNRILVVRQPVGICVLVTPWNFPAAMATRKIGPALIDGAMVAKMRNAGEACTAANRFYVESPIAEEFAGRLAQRMAGLVVGPGTDPGTQVGPLVNEDTVAKVDGLVRGAVDAGARVATGGTRPDGPGFYYPPTVLTGVRPDSAILREEIFGPVAPIVTFEDEADAIRLANDTEYGLVAYVYTGDLARGLRVSEAIEAGMVGLNRGLVGDPAAPFGGTKQSGLGREGGHEGMLDYLESKYIAVSW